MGKYPSTQSPQAQIRRTADQNKKIHLGSPGCIFFLLQKLIIGNNYGFIRGQRLATVGELSGYSPTGHTHDDRYYTETEINNLLNGKANASHTHDAAQITAGTFGGLVKAATSTSTASQLRNISFSSSDPGVGSALTSGEVLLVYE